MRSALLLTVALFGSSLAFAADETAPPKGLPLDGVRWAGPAVNSQTLQGKSTLVLVYASWCPKCNVWSEELFTGLKEGIQDKPVVLLAIYADDTPNEAQKYITERAFTAPNILHGYDPAMPKKLGFASNLFHYVLLNPAGEIVDRGQAGASYNVGGKKIFSPVYKLNQMGSVGSFHVLSTGLSPNVQSMLWPLELGQADDAAVSKARGSLNADEKAELDGCVEKFMEAGLKEVKENYKGDLAQKFTAHSKATQLAGVFTTSASSKTAREVLQFMEKDETFKKELAAKKAYEGCLQKNPTARRTLLKSVATRFDGTQYGELAQEAAAK